LCKIFFLAPATLKIVSFITPSIAGLEANLSNAAWIQNAEGIFKY